MNHAELESWADEAARGDRSALARLYDALSGGLYGFLLGMAGQPALAEDLLQQTFLIAIERLPRRKKGNVRAWLYTIAHNLAIDAIRARRRVTVSVLPDDPDPAPSPTHRLEAGELVEQLHAEVARLPDSQREVLLLRYHGGLSFKQIAELLGCPLNTALTRAHYGLRKLREAMVCEI